MSTLRPLEKVMKYTRNPIFLIFTILLGLVLIARPFGLSDQAEQPGLPFGPTKGALAPLISTQNFGGDNVNLESLKGKIVVINFWASWCPPCRAEMQAFQNVSKQYDPSEVMIVGLNSTFQDDLGQAEAFIAERQITFPIWLDLNGEITRLYQVRAMPTTFFIDASGIVKNVMIGGPLDEAVITITIEEMLGEVQEQ